jgi:cell division protein FtsB
MESVVAKIQKHLDTMTKKNEKLVEENRILKEKISELKSLNSRVRKIPKKPLPEEPQTTQA